MGLGLRVPSNLPSLSRGVPEAKASTSAACSWRVPATGGSSGILPRPFEVRFYGKGFGCPCLMIQEIKPLALSLCIYVYTCVNTTIWVDMHSQFRQDLQLVKVPVLGPPKASLRLHTCPKKPLLQPPNYALNRLFQQVFTHGVARSQA